MFLNNHLEEKVSPYAFQRIAMLKEQKKAAAKTWQCAIASASFIACYHSFNDISKCPDRSIPHTEQIIIFHAYIMLIYGLVGMIGMEEILWDLAVLWQTTLNLIIHSSSTKNDIMIAIWVSSEPSKISIRTLKYRRGRIRSRKSEQISHHHESMWNLSGLTINELAWKHAHWIQNEIAPIGDGSYKKNSPDAARLFAPTKPPHGLLSLVYITTRWHLLFIGICLLKLVDRNSYQSLTFFRWQRRRSITVSVKGITRWYCLQSSM